jgi:hypothetical protein
MAGETKNFRTTYATEHLPVELGEKVCAETRGFLKFLNEATVTTHPCVRAMINGIEPYLNMLEAEVMADKLVGGEDEMDVWERNGIKAKE